MNSAAAAAASRDNTTLTLDGTSQRSLDELDERSATSVSGTRIGASLRDVDSRGPASVASLRNATNNRRTAEASSQGTFDQSESTTTDLLLSNAASDVVCDDQTCRLADSGHLSTSASTPRKMNVTNNAMLVVTTATQPVPQTAADRQPSKDLSVVDVHSPSFTAFPDKPDVATVGKLPGVWSSFDPVFANRTPKFGVIAAAAEASRMQETPADVTAANKAPSQPLKPVRAKTEKSGGGQDGRADVSDGNDASSKTVATA